MPGFPEALLKTLQNYGLSEKEATVYLTLLRMGPSKAGLLAQSTGLNRMEVYRTLYSLRRRGAVESKAGKPMVFAASPIAQLVNGLVEEQKERLTRFEQGRQTLEAELKKLAGLTMPALEHRFRILEGRRHVYSHMATMFEGAQKEVCVMTTRNDLIRMKLAGLDDILEGRVNQGVDVQVTSDIDKQGLEAVERFLAFSHLKSTNLPPSGRLVIVDGTQTLTSVVLDDEVTLNTDQDIGLWTDARQYVALVRRLFNDVYANSADAGPVVAQLGLEVRRQRTAEKLIETVSARLQESGWQAQAPGVLSGSSGASHNFDLVAKYEKPGTKPMALQVVLAEGKAVSVNEAVPFFLRAVDCKPVEAVLVAVPRLDVRAQRLARFYGVETIEGAEDAEIALGLVKALRRTYRALLSTLIDLDSQPT